MVFIIPAAPAPAAEPAPDPAAETPQPMRPSFPDVTGRGPGAGRAFDPYGGPSEPDVVHIPCPKGHLLETPPEMIGEDVMCPHCGVQFKLFAKNSVEHKRKKREEQERADYKSGKTWFTWAVVVVAAVAIALILMIALGDW